MMAITLNNNFLVNLLALQQDGRQAISAPTNWTTQEPLLDVTTDVDEIINDLEAGILRSENKNDIARWHFFIGSPGNGKSAAIGKLCRRLLKLKDCKILDEQECPIQELQPADVPYALDIYEKDNKFASVRIVQDASVVRNPFSADVDPSRELVLTVEQAWEKGISLIVCTNRGVLEKAYRDNQTKKEINSKPWFKVLSHIVLSKLTLNGKLDDEIVFQGKKPVFKKAKITFSHLDNRSLLLGSDIFDRIVQKAINPELWEPCNDCLSKSLCPYKANRDWLSDPQGRKYTIQLLQKAEVLSGQIIVFREALALVSFILAGCARDYGDSHPCEWVKKKTNLEDYFSLAVRRIFMALFSSFAPYGLEILPNFRKDQVDALCIMQKSLVGPMLEIKKSIEFVVSSPAPSTDVGLTRLISESGVLVQIDPCRESLPEDFYDTWDSDFSAIQEIDNPLIAAIDRKCITIWANLERAIESTADYTASKSYWALRRWSSNYLLHLGCLLEGRTAWSKELDEYLQILEAVARDPGIRTIEEKRSIRDFESRLEALLDTGSKNLKTSGTVLLSDAVNIEGRWVINKLKPRIVASEKMDSISIALQFEGGEKAKLGASMYIWLCLRARGNLDPRCFPSDLLTGAIDARIRAAAKGKYAYANDDIELRIQAGEDKVYRLIRLDGDVDIKYE